MSIIQIQRKYAEMFRIRLGQKAASGAPESLKGEIRITSPSKEWVKAFADTYGGRPKRWGDTGKFEVFLPTNRLPITILPGQNLTQHMELWGGSVCQRRCNGVEMSGGAPCICGEDAPLEDRECKPTSRLTVACPEIGLVGTGMLVTHSTIAAAEWAGSFSIAQPILDMQRTVDAILRVDALSTPGHNFNVPRLELQGITFAEIESATEQLAISMPSTPELTQGGE